MLLTVMMVMMTMMIMSIFELHAKYNLYRLPLSWASCPNTASALPSAGGSFSGSWLDSISPFRSLLENIPHPLPLTLAQLCVSGNVHNSVCVL